MKLIDLLKVTKSIKGSTGFQIRFCFALQRLGSLDFHDLFLFLVLGSGPEHSEVV